MDLTSKSQQSSFNHRKSKRNNIQNSTRGSNNSLYRSKNSNVNNIEQTPPTVKILVKSSSNSACNSVVTSNQDTNNHNTSASKSAQKKTSVLPKPRPAVNILEKTIHSTLKLPYVNNIIDIIKLIDFEFNFIQETSIIDSMLMPDLETTNQMNTTSAPTQAGITIQPTVSSSNTNFGAQSFCIVAAIGMEGTGKSSLLNTIAQCNVFPTRLSMAKNNRENPLSHVTKGIDLHITSERVFLLDTQPLLSASVLDDLMRINTERISSGCMSGSKHFYISQMCTPIFSSVVGFDIGEIENFAFIYSLQMLTFLITICDHVILVLDSLTLDAHLFKLLATALMMVGDADMSKTNIIIYLKTFNKQSLANAEKSYQNISNKKPFLDQNEKKFESLFKNTIKSLLGTSVNIDFICNDESLLTTTVLRPPYSRSLVKDQSCSTISYQSERLWFHSIQRFWDISIRKSTLFSDYARYLP